MINKKIAIVTGASRGIGIAIASRLVQSGYFVIGTATNEIGEKKITNMFGCNDGRGLILNVNDKDNIDFVIKNISKTYGTISILVNNAGIVRDKLFLRMSENDWDEVMQTNLKAIFLLTKLVIPGMMTKRFGRIINISSVSGFTGPAGQANYSSTKAAIVAFSKSLANELGSRNITVNCVAPGFIETEMTNKVAEEIKVNYLKNIPLKRYGKPEDVAGVVNFLVGDEASYITGTTIHVNGGLYM